MIEDFKRFTMTRQMFPREADSSIMRQCQHSKPFEPKTRNVINFLMLRESGQCLKKALAFSTKRFCRYDTTQTKDGTSNFRILKRKPTQAKYIQYGWATNGEPIILNDLPDINGIMAGIQEQDNLIKQLVNTKMGPSF